LVIGERHHGMCSHGVILPNLVQSDMDIVDPNTAN
jgi:hypothetical protein